jgi:NAD(P)-dependent dehydrogenase (short-subunit alcohol dehydrogenase family)
MPQFAVIAGVGAGTGRSLALKFSQAYSVALLARSPASYESIVEEINKNGGKAIGISTDVSDSASVKKAFKQIEEELGSTCSAAVFNASGGFKRAPFLETDEQTFVNSMSVSA